jgi:tetratricopeptide (TPR) repeat protein
VKNCDLQHNSVRNLDRRLLDQRRAIRNKKPILFLPIDGKTFKTGQRCMIPLPYPDQFHINAALGWLLLDNITEAARDFRNIRGPYDHHPDYLQIRCRLLMASKEWDEALAVSTRQVRIAPERPHGWLNHAYCLHELNRTKEAFTMLLPAAGRFPCHDLISFNLACYCCHLEDFKEALRWLNRTIRLVRPTEGI